MSVVNASPTKPQEGLLFTVGDTGIGIPPEKQELLFDSFTQVDSSNTRMFGGTGLGLAICRQLVQLMGGEIGVRSEKGEGCKFWFTVNLDNLKKDDTALPKPLESSEERAVLADNNIRCRVRQNLLEDRAGFRLLLVEDNQINQQVVCGILANLGINNVDVAEHGVEALQALGKRRKGYDLILMDIQMPVMDGIETTKRIRAGTNGNYSADMPIIALTAHALKSDLDRCIKAGMNDFLTKPVLPEILEKILQKWLMRSSGSSGSVSSVAAAHPAQENEQPAEQAVSAAPVAYTSGEVNWESSPVFDYSALKRRMMGDDQIAKEIIEVYWLRLPGQLEELKGLVAAGLQTETLRLVHNLKGSSGSVGAMQLHQLFKMLEHAAKEHESLGELLAIIENQTQEFGTVLHEYIP